MKVEPIARFPCDKEVRTGRLLRIATCGGCGYIGKVGDATTGLPTDFLANKFRQKGWNIGKRSGDDRCPECVAAEKAAKVRRTKTAEVFHIREDEEGTMSVVKSSATVAAEPPRQPTREDRRRILDRLDQVYDTEKPRYLGKGCDADLAAELDVPRAWVAAIREDLFGPDENEHSSLTDQAIANLEAALKALADEFMAKHAKLETDLAALKAGRLPRAA